MHQFQILKYHFNVSQNSTAVAYYRDFKITRACGAILDFTQSHGCAFQLLQNNYYCLTTVQVKWMIGAWKLLYTFGV